VFGACQGHLVLHFVPQKNEYRSRPRPRIKISYDAITPLLASADTLCIVAASVLGAGGYQLLLSGSIGDVGPLVGLSLIGGLAYGFSARQLGLYDLPSVLHPRHEYLRIVLAALFLMFVLTTTLFLFKVGEQVSRGSVVGFFFLVTCLLLVSRRLAGRRLRHALLTGSIAGQRAVLLGTSAELAGLSHHRLLTDFGIDEAQRVILPYRTADQPVAPAELVALETAVNTVRDLNVDQLVVCVPWDNVSQLHLIRDKLRILPLPVRLLPDRFVRSVWELQKCAPPLVIDIQRAPLTGFEQIFKRALDLVIASMALLALTPLMGLTALMVRLESRGPAIFRQRRKGFNGREFQIYKFRTMRVMEDGPVIAQARPNDKRVTTLGRILRSTSIDELPQLFNVLRGEMSIIGPRPHAVAHDDHYGDLIAHYAFRHHVKPGITGWAQVNGFRGETRCLEQMQERVWRDLWYIDNWSIGLDLKILVRTCFEVVRSSNAY
jgi:undecaprenyl-phosphate galactose phosphotransferase/putative colanic acid biosynthesis UDP-glucose lipid carrier transferase